MSTLLSTMIKGWDMSLVWFLFSLCLSSDYCLPRSLVVTLPGKHRAVVVPPNAGDVGLSVHHGIIVCWHQAGLAIASSLLLTGASFRMCYMYGRCLQ